MQVEYGNLTVDLPLLFLCICLNQFVSHKKERVTAAIIETRLLIMFAPSKTMNGSSRMTKFGWSVATGSIGASVSVVSSPSERSEGCCVSSAGAESTASSGDVVYTFIRGKSLS